MGGLKIGELAQRVGVTPKTLRFYDEMGLLPPTERTPSGYRLYSEREVARLIFIRKAARIGLFLDEVREFLALYDQGQPCCSQVQGAMQHKVDELTRRITELTALRDSLARLLKAPVRTEANSETICPLIEHGSESI